MRWYVLLALLVIVTLLLIQESDGWRRRGGGFRLRRSVRGFRTRRLRRAVRFRTRRLRRPRFRTRRLRRLRFRTRRLRRLRFRTRRLRRLRFRTRRLRRFRFRTRRLRRLRFRTRRLRRLRFRTRRLRRLSRRLRRLRFRTRLSRIRIRKVLKRFKLKRLKRKVKKLINKVKKKIKKSGKWWKVIKGKLKNIGESVLKQLYNYLLKKKGSGGSGGDNGPDVQPPQGPGPPPPAPVPTEDPLLVVQQGEFTFLAEGDDDPSSPYFSRRLHVFSNSSGVTVGRGYDLKDKTTTQIKTDLLAVGINRNTAEKLTNAIHLEGDKAKAWIKSNNLESFTVTKQQQKTLFEREYPKQVSRAKAMTEKYTKTGLKFDQLKQVVKDIIVDIFYRGDYSMSDAEKKERSIIMQEAFDESKKSLTALTDLMLDIKFWVTNAAVDENRFYVRANYISDACNKDKQNCNPQ